MRNLLLVFGALLFAGLVSGQNFAPLNAEWHFQSYSTSPHEKDYFKVRAVGDTVLEGKNAVVLEYKRREELIPQAEVILYEDSNRVYFYEDGDFKLLYDFNLNAGDTLKFSVPVDMGYYDFTCGEWPDSATSYSVVIDSVSLETIDGQMLKTLFTSPVEFDEPRWLLGQITEKIGSYNGLFGSSELQCLGGFPGNFRCYNDSEVFYKAVSVDCDEITSIDEKVNDPQIEVYPNPASVELLISGLNGFSQYRLYSVSGQLVLEGQTSATSMERIDLAGIKPGLYVLKIKDGQNNSVVNKIVVNSGN